MPVDRLEQREDLVMSARKGLLGLQEFGVYLAGSDPQESQEAQERGEFKERTENLVNRDLKDCRVCLGRSVCRVIRALLVNLERMEIMATLVPWVLGVMLERTGSQVFKDHLVPLALTEAGDRLESLELEDSR